MCLSGILYQRTKGHISLCIELRDDRWFGMMNHSWCTDREKGPLGVYGSLDTKVTIVTL